VNLSRAVALHGLAARRGQRYGGGAAPPLLLSRRHGGSAAVAACCSSSPPLGTTPSSFPAVRGLGGDSSSGAGSATSLPADHPGGIGIAEFLGAKNFLVTGGTGFLAKGDTASFC
jgi:fatty acyl-CoA reductase